MNRSLTSKRVILSAISGIALLVVGCAGWNHGYSLPKYAQRCMSTLSEDGAESLRLEAAYDPTIRAYLADYGRPDYIYVVDTRKVMFAYISEDQGAIFQRNLIAQSRVIRQSTIRPALMAVLPKAEQTRVAKLRTTARREQLRELAEVNKPKTSRKQHSPVRQRVDSEQFALETLGWSWRIEHGYLVAEGEIRNLRADPIKNLTAVVTFRTSDGKFVKSDSALVEYQPLMPGQTSPWKVLAPHNPVIAGASVEFKLLFGGTVPARPR